MRRDCSRDLPEIIGGGQGIGAPVRKTRGREEGGDMAAGVGAMACSVNGLTSYFPCQEQ